MSSTYIPCDDNICLYYDKVRNAMFDECGFEVVDVFRYITPNMLYLFKTKKEYMAVYGVDGQVVELFYP